MVAGGLSTSIAALLLLRASGTAVPPTFTVDLTLPPEQRWVGALELLPHSWDESWAPIFAYHNATLFDALPDGTLAALARALDAHYPEHAAELRGLARSFGRVYPGRSVSYEYLAGWVYFHELAHTDAAAEAAGERGRAERARECTGALAADAAGRVVHAANMDQTPEAVRNVTLRVRFVGDEGLFVGDEGLVFEGVDWYWFTTGVSRAVRRGLASLQENWRTQPPRPLGDALDDIARGAVAQILVFRRALTRAARAPTTTFAALVEELERVPLAAPYYVVAAGARPFEGVAFARNCSGPDGAARRLGEGGAWFVVQTNYDPWLPDPADDPRRSVAEATLAQFGRAEAASSLGGFAVASTYPVHNPHTAYTAIMSAASGELHAYVRDAMCPENPGAVPSDQRYCTA